MSWILTVIFIFLMLFAIIKRVDIVSAFSEGVAEGFSTLKTIFPNILFVLSVIFLLRSSGIITLLSRITEPFFRLFSLPSEIIPLLLLRPLSGSASTALLGNIMQSYGADSLLSITAAVISASTETTFYTISVYLGNERKNCGKLIFTALLLDFITMLTATAITPLIIQ